MAEATAAAKQRYTFADLEQIDDERIYEILGGDLVVFSSPDEPHAAVVMGIVRFLLAAEDRGYGRVRAAPRAVAFDYAQRGSLAADVTHPDVFFVREARRAILGQRCVEAAPDLLVEVLSPSTRELDLPGGRSCRSTSGTACRITGSSILRRGQWPSTRGKTEGTAPPPSWAQATRWRVHSSPA